MYDAFHLAEAASDTSPRASSDVEVTSETKLAASDGELRVRIPFIYLYRMLPVAQRLN